MKNLKPLVAILRGITPDEVLAHIKALVSEGFTTIEIPLNSPDWRASIALAVKHYGRVVQIGAGTVTTPSEVSVISSLGCSFILTPNTDPSVIMAAKKAKMLTCIGCHTVSEAFVALKHSADALKIFPAGELGPGYIRALKAVLPDETPLYAVGGIKSDNLINYLKAGCIGAGLGGELYLAGQSVSQTTDNAKTFIEVFNRFRT